MASFTSNSWKQSGGLNRTKTNQNIKAKQMVPSILNITEQLGVENSTTPSISNFESSSSTFLYNFQNGKNFNNNIAYYSFNKPINNTGISNESLNPLLYIPSNFDLNYRGSGNPLSLVSSPFNQNATQFSQNATTLISDICYNTQNIFGTDPGNSVSYAITVVSYIYVSSDASNFCFFGMDNSNQDALTNNGNIISGISNEAFYLWYPDYDGKATIYYTTISPSSGKTYGFSSQIDKVIKDQWHVLNVTLNGQYVYIIQNGETIFTQPFSTGTRVPNQPIAINLSSKYYDSNTNSVINPGSTNRGIIQLLDYNIFNLSADPSSVQQVSEFRESIKNINNASYPNRDLYLNYAIGEDINYLASKIIAGNGIGNNGSLTNFGEFNNFSRANFYDTTTFYGNVAFDSSASIIYDSSINGALEIYTLTGNAGQVTSSFLIENAGAVPGYSFNPTMLVYNGTSGQITRRTTQNLVFSISGENVSVGDIFGTHTFDVSGSSYFYGNVGVSGLLNVNGGINVSDNLDVSGINFTNGYIGISQDTDYGPIRIGNAAGQTTQGNFSVAIGNNAGQTDQSNNSIAIGSSAGQTNQKQYSIAMGDKAGETSQNQYSIAIGTNAGQTDQSAGCIAIGTNAGDTSQNQYSIAIGKDAGSKYQSTNAIAMGQNAALSNQSSNAIAIGNEAGETDQSANSIAIGQNAGNTSLGQNSIAIGSNTVNQFTTSVALGAGATTTANNQIVLGTVSENVYIPGNLDISGNLSANNVGPLSDNRLENNVASPWIQSAGSISQLNMNGYMFTRAILNYNELNTSPTGLIFGTGANTNQSDYLSLVTSGLTRLYIIPGGTVGINTTTPDNSYRLDVSGNVKISGPLNVQLNYSNASNSNTSIDGNIISDNIYYGVYSNANPSTQMINMNKVFSVSNWVPSTSSQTITITVSSSSGGLNSFFTTGGGNQGNGEHNLTLAKIYASQFQYNRAPPVATANGYLIVKWYKFLENGGSSIPSGTWGSQSTGTYLFGSPTISATQIGNGYYTQNYSYDSNGVELPGWMYGSWSDTQYQLIITFPQQMGTGSDSVHKITTLELLRSVSGYKTEVTLTP